MDKYNKKKLKSQRLSQLMDSVNLVTPNTVTRVGECGNMLEFIADSTMEHLKLNRGNFCTNRFCPMCAWRKTLKDTQKISIMMHYLKEIFDMEFLFLTLTVPNVEGDKLNDEIKRINKAFSNLTKRKDFECIKGFIRKLEVTYAKEPVITKELFKRKKAYYTDRGLKVGDIEPNYNTYHPHFHVVLAVNKSYFTDPKYYKSQAKWLEMWREVTGDYDITQVDIRKIYSSDLESICELAKYSAKDSDYMVSEDVFKTFYGALKGKQLITYSGVFKEAVKLYDEGKLDKYKPKDMIDYIYIMLYIWGGKEYQEHTIREMTEDERQLYNKKLIEFMEE